jgi:predicted dehydrogenase
MPIRIAQYGTKHGHALGKIRSMINNPDVDFAGVYEPDPAARTRAEQQWKLPQGRWYRDVDELLADRPAAVAVEGRNDESLAMARQMVDAGKHIWYDKPAGDDWPSYQRLIETVRARGIYLQMGYMFRYHNGFSLIAGWARGGLLGDIFGVRAHMSTTISVQAREVISRHRGGVFYDLAGHMLDQVVWLLGRPTSATVHFRNDATPEAPEFSDNTLGVFEFGKALAFIDIAAMETRPTARRLEVYGTKGSATMEPFEPATEVRLSLAEPSGAYSAGEQFIPIDVQSRRDLYDLELPAFVAAIEGRQPPDRPLEHEILVQESLLRATGGIS